MGKQNSIQVLRLFFLTSLEIDGTMDMMCIIASPISGLTNKKKLIANKEEFNDFYLLFFVCNFLQIDQIYLFTQTIFRSSNV